MDAENRRPVDVLPERSADSFAAWLAARRGAELICRDPGRLLGVRRTPDAIQVVDRRTPSLHQLAALTYPGFVRAACHPSLHRPRQVPSASPACCDRRAVKVLTPLESTVPDGAALCRSW